MPLLKREQDAQALSREFSKLLAGDLGLDIMQEVIKRNLTYPPHTCASHDFCDANMVMDRAKENLKLGLDISSQADVLVWSRAWELAVTNKFYLQEVPK
jgi:hypothetical protein